MKSCIATAVVVVVGAASVAAQENALYRDLMEKGVPMSDGTAVKLPAPTIRPSMDAAAQQAALAKIAGQDRSPDELLRKSQQAPFVLNIRSVPGSNPKSPARAVDLWFVAHGDWNTATSSEFLDNLWKTAKKESGKTKRAAAGELKADELTRRNIEMLSTPGIEERFVYSVSPLLERVELSAAVQTVVSRDSDSVLVAQRIHPAFDGDSKLPNRWRSLRASEDGSSYEHGPPLPYHSAGAYGRAVRLVEPAGAILFEFHLVYEEPEGWFGGVNLVRSKLPLAAQDQIRTFRRKLANASSAGK